MILFVNENNEIKDVNITSNKSLIPLYVNENNDMFPFKGWSIAKICCYKVNVQDGIITMMTPYVDSRMLEHIDQLGKEIEVVTPYEAKTTASVKETEVTFIGVPEGISLITTVKDLEGHLIEHNTIKSGDIVKVTFEPLQYSADIFLSVN
jgi:hypothetical protein